MSVDRTAGSCLILQCVRLSSYRSLQCHVCKDGDNCTSSSQIATYVMQRI